MSKRLFGIIVYEKEAAEYNRHYIDMYFKACEKRNIDLKLVLIERLTFLTRENEACLIYDGEKLPLPDFAVMRTNSVLLARFLELYGVHVFNNSDCIENANDKRLTYMRAQSIGLKIMDTYYSVADVHALHAEFPLVVKSAHGAGGRSVMLAHNEEELQAAIDSISPDSPVIQKLASDVGKDLRVYFVGNEIVCAILRQSSSDFRSNYGLGGSATIYELNEDEKRLAYKAASMFDLAYAGVDFIFDNGEMVFNEVEDAVGARMVYANTDIDIVDIYVDYIQRKVGAKA